MTLPLLLAGYMLGIVAAVELPTQPETHILLLPAVILSLIFLATNNRTIRGFTSLLLACNCGLLACLLAISPPRADDHIVHHISRNEQTIEGRVLSSALRPREGVVIDLEAQSLIVGETDIPVQGRLRLYVEEGANDVSPGDRIRFRSRLNVPRPFGTPGEFNLSRHLAAEGIFVTAFVRSSHDILPLQHSPAATGAISQGRQTIARAIEQAVEPKLAPLVKALAIGDKSGLAPELSETLARGGVSHLFAISGLHLGLIATALYGITLTLYRRHPGLLRRAPPARVLPVLIAPAMVCYLLWTGSAFSTQRALLMFLALSALFLLRRRTATMNILWLAAAVILLFDPLALFSPSFQLSFAAVAGIVLGMRHWQPHIALLPTPARWILTLFFTSLSATFATVPLVLLHFHLLAPAGIIINLVAIPLIGWLAVPAALIGSLLHPFSSEAGALFFLGCQTIIGWMLALVQQVTVLPGLSGWPVYLSHALLLALSSLTVALLVGESRRLIFYPSLLLAAIALCLTPRPEPGVTICALSVGQGESILVSIDDKHYLVDGGGLHSERIDTGRQLIAPALGRLGVRELEAAILTHDHPDHAKGIASIITNLPCRLLLHGDPFAENSPLLHAIAQTQTPTRSLPFGWNTLHVEGDSSLMIFRPASGTNPNDRSLVVYVRHGMQGALLTADLERPGVQELLDHFPNLPVTLLKLPHHGSQRSSPELLLQRFHPATIFVSAGYQNRYNFPHDSVVTELAQRKIPLWRTDLNGSFSFTSTGTNWMAKKL